MGAGQLVRHRTQLRLGAFGAGPLGEAHETPGGTAQARAVGVLGEGDEAVGQHQRTERGGDGGR